MWASTIQGKTATGKLLGFKTLITPSKEGQKRHLLKMKGMVRRHRDKTQEELITSLNKVNPGWARYYRTVVSNHIAQVRLLKNYIPA